MPRVSRPDGVELNWDVRGEGPLIVIANQFFGHWTVFGRMISLLSEHHRVVTYDPRGIGDSSLQGPYEIDTDACDLGAVIEAAGAPAVVVVAMGDGSNRAVRLASERPELVGSVVCVAGNPVGRAVVGSDGLAASDSVLDALQSMMETDYRGALRTMITTANPDWDEDAVRERVNVSVEHCPQEAAAPRMRSWIQDESADRARSLGGRLWILEDGTNPWFLQTAERTAELLPDAHVFATEDGAISRPDIAASYVSALTGAGQAATKKGRTQRHGPSSQAGPRR